MCVVRSLSSIIVGLAVCSILALLLSGAYKLYEVKTGSMSPTIPVGSLVVVKPRQLPHPGQVVTFQDQGHITTHRFLRRNPDGTLVTKGDANGTADPWKLTNANVVGTVVFHIPYVGLPITWIIVAILVAMLLVALPQKKRVAAG